MEDENTTNGSSPQIFASLEPIIEESLLEDTWKNSMPNYMAVAPSTPISILPTTTEDWDAFFDAPPPPSPKRLRTSIDILASMGTQRSSESFILSCLVISRTKISSEKMVLLKAK